MDNFKNRIGHDNFVWWIGVIEDRDDPLHLGRCKVRIFGSHTENLQLIPTSSLPWAMPLYPVNDPRRYSSPMEGEYVFGFFTDGLSSQAPVYMGVFPGIPQSEPRAGVGFSALASQTKTASAANTAASANTTAANTLSVVGAVSSAFTTAANTYTTALNSSISGLLNAPSTFKSAPAMQVSRVGKPTIPANAYTTSGTIVQITNSQVTHACDFRFLIDFPNLDIGVIENPITLIENAIKNSKNKAAAIIRTMLAQLIDNFRLILKGINAVLNLDPTGQIAKIISQVREVIRTINYYSKKLAEIIGNAALIVALISELKQVVEWIKNLPANILALLQGCLNNFQGAVKAATTQISLIPGQISSSVETAFQQLESSTADTIAQAQQAEQTANVPNTLITFINSPDTANLNVLSEYITTQFPNANVIISNSNDAAFNVANSSTP